MGGNTFDSGMVPNLWPMNLDPAMDPSASNNVPTQSNMGSSTVQQSGAATAGAPQNGFGGAYMGST
jgi:hypothetical protein